MTTTDTRWLEAAERQMPTLWAKHEATVREYLHHSGGGMMVLQRTLDEATGAHIILAEDDDFGVYVYSDDGEQCEGHRINVTDSDSNAVWWFLNGSTYPEPCPCLADNA
jgi:hypothetical protein